LSLEEDSGRRMMKDALWKTDVREAARVLLKKIENTEQITINAGGMIEQGFGVHRGRICCDEYDLMKSVAEFVFEVEVHMSLLRERVDKLEASLSLTRHS
jgi:hypothetical protein